MMHYKSAKSQNEFLCILGYTNMTKSDKLWSFENLNCSLYLGSHFCHFFYTLLDPSSNPQKVTYSGEDEANHIDQSGQLVDNIILVR
jgi:hypothetical protein